MVQKYFTKKMKLNKQNILKSLEKVSAPGEGKSLVEGGNIKNIQVLVQDQGELNKQYS